MNDRQSLENELQRLRQRHAEQPEGRVFAPLADCLRKMGELQEALDVCRTGLEKHPRYSSAYVILGKIHLERADDDAAREAFERVLEFDPQNLLALRQLAELDEARGDLVAAASRWEAVCGLEIDPARAEERLEALRARLPEAPPESESVQPLADEESAQPDGEPGPEPFAEDLALEADRPEADDIAPLEEFEEPAEDPIEMTIEGADEEPIADTDEEAIQHPAQGADEPMAEEPVGESEEVFGDPDATEIPAPRRRADDAGVPTTEIATMTLAEIYAEQGFRDKALEILRQIVERHPDAERVTMRIAELESEEPADAAPTAGDAQTSDQAGVDEEIARTLAPEPITLSASAPEIDEAEPEVSPSPPLEAPASAETEEERERERFEHFRSWLDRIRVDD